MSSIKTVAKLANVSVATVSRVLNNDNKVKAETRERVLKVIEEIDYRPNLLAKNLRKKSSSTILIVLPTISNPIFNEIIRGAETAIKEKGYNVIIGTTELDNNQLETFINLLKTQQVDGAVFLSSSINKNKLKEIADDYSVVMCNEYFDEIDVPYVSIDNKRAGYDACKYLFERGKNNIAYIRGYIDSSSSLGRLDGYKKAHKEKNVPYNTECIIKGSNDFEKLRLQTIKLIEEHPSIDGLLVNSDIQASIVLKTLKQLGLRIPEDVGIISFDGTIISQIVDPSLTSIVQPMYELGYQSVEILIDKLNKNEVKNMQVILPHRLVKRDT
jgi:DNA-binding LacI/PurR family transcriptional regulator